MNDEPEPTARDEQREEAAAVLTEEAPPPPPPPRRLRRRTDNKLLGGVASGLADHLGLDVVVVRVIMVVLAVTPIGPLTVVAYLLAWLLIPAADTDRSIGEEAARRHRGDLATWIGIGLIVIAVVALLPETYLWPFSPGPLILIAIGVGLFIYARRDDRPAHPATAVAPSPGAPPYGAHQTQPPPPPAYGAHATAPLAPPTAPSPSAPTAPPPTATAPPPPPPPERPSRPRSILGQVTIGAILVALGGLALVDALEILDPRGVHYVATMLTVTGLGLVAGAWWGRSRGLIVLGVLLLPLVAGASVAEGLDVGSFRGGVGDRVHIVDTVDDLRPNYRLLAGDLVVDMSRLELDGEVAEVRATVTFGELTVIVPDDAGLDVTASAGAGEVHVPGGGVENGVGPELQVTEPGRGLIVIRGHANFGQVNVVHADGAWDPVRR